MPDNLDDTPGPPVVVTSDLYEGSRFTARYPDGWRVVTGEANAPPTVFFVSPDETATIQLIVGALENVSFTGTALQTDIRTLTLSDDLLVTAILRAPADEWDTIYLPVFEWVLASVMITP